MEMTSIIPDQPANGLSPATAKTVAAIQARANALTAIATFIHANHDLPGSPVTGDYGTLVPLSTNPDPKAAVSAWMLRAIDAGADVEAFSNAHNAGVRLHFGAAYIQAYARAELLGERVEVVTSEWRLGIEIPVHARRDEGAQAVSG